MKPCRWDAFMIWAAPSGATRWTTNNVSHNTGTAQGVITPVAMKHISQVAISLMVVDSNNNNYGLVCPP
eukprot:8408447-Prorocentrum_lima.AAC.1